jgi:hypothetical protein
LKLVSLPFQLKFLGVKVRDMDHGLLPIETASSQAPEAPCEPKTFNNCTEHLLRIADLENRVTILKHQIMTAMDQAKKSSALSQKMCPYKIKCLLRWQELLISENVTFT